MLFHLLVILLSLFVIGAALWDIFETVVLPRRVSRRFRLTNIHMRSTWSVYSSLARRISSTPDVSRRWPRLDLWPCCRCSACG